MQVKLLGTAAGGGLPQWNCNCANCREARRGSGRVRPWTQSGVAISAGDGRCWFLLNASPDLARQMESFPPLQPASFHPRGTTIQGVLLTNADLDHTLGLLLLREGARLPIYSSNGTREVLTGPMALLPFLDSFCGITVFNASLREEKLRHLVGSDCSLSYEAFVVPCKTPRFSCGTGGGGGRRRNCHRL